MVVLFFLDRKRTPDKKAEKSRRFEVYYQEVKVKRRIKKSKRANYRKVHITRIHRRNTSHVFKNFGAPIRYLLLSKGSSIPKLNLHS